MSPSILAVICFATWTILMALVMVNHRVFYVLTGRRRINTFTPHGVAVSPFQARACRLHANCYENFPVFAALILCTLDYPAASRLQTPRRCSPPTRTEYRR